MEVQMSEMVWTSEATAVNWVDRFGRDEALEIGQIR